jgi:hypothetical protein
MLLTSVIHKPEGLDQWIVANGVGHLATYVLARVRFESPWVICTSTLRSLLRMSSMNMGKRPMVSPQDFPRKRNTHTHTMENLVVPPLFLEISEWRVA